MSSPIDIPSSPRSPRSTYVGAVAGSSSSSGSASSSFDFAPKLYVPMHRRNRDTSPAPSNGTFSTRSSLADVTAFSTRSSISSDIFSTRPSFSSGRTSPDFFSHHQPSAPGVYSREDLLLLADSPLSKLAPGAKTAIRDVVPDIVLSRRKAETKRWKARQEEHQRRRDVHSHSHYNVEFNPRASWSSDEGRW